MRISKPETNKQLPELSSRLSTHSKHSVRFFERNVEDEFRNLKISFDPFMKFFFFSWSITNFQISHFLCLVLDDVIGPCSGSQKGKKYLWIKVVKGDRRG